MPNEEYLINNSDENGYVETEPSVRSRGKAKLTRQNSSKSDIAHESTTWRCKNSNNASIRMDSDVVKICPLRESESETEQKNREEKYAKIIKIWNQNKFLAKYSNPQKKTEPSYMKNTISSISKSKKQLQLTPYHKYAQEPL